MSAPPPAKTGPLVKLRHRISRIFPDSVLQFAKEQYYAQRIKRVSERVEPDLIVVKQLLHPGDYTVDVGANVGIYTKFLSEFVGAEGRVYSIEPIPMTLEILRSNIRKLSLDNVVIVSSAVSERTGIATMEVPLWSSGTENLARAGIIEKGAQGSLRHLQVNITTLDILLAAAPKPVSFIKLDVEGHELQCIRGATSTMSNSRPAWLVEVWGDPQDETDVAHTTFELMVNFGYQPFWFDGTTLFRYHPGQRSLNFWFLLPQHIEWLRHRVQIEH